MTRKSDKHGKATILVKSLPRDREILKRVLDEVTRYIRYGARDQHRRTSFQTKFKALLDRECGTQKLASFIKSFGKKVVVVEEKDWGAGAPSMDLVVKYINPAQLKITRELRDDSLSEFRLALNSLETKSACSAVVAAFARYSQWESFLLAHFVDLRDRVMAALEKADSADRKTDNKIKTGPAVPENLRVVQLAKAIGKRSNQGASQKDIAIAFTKGDEKKAASLLRQVRRFKLQRRR